MPELIKPCKLCNNRGVVSGNEYCDCIYGELDRSNDRCEQLTELMERTKKELDDALDYNEKLSASIKRYAPPSFDTIQHELVGFTHIYCVNRLCKHHCRDDKYGCSIHGMGLDNDPSPCKDYIDYKKFYKDEYDAYVAKEEEKRQKQYNENVGSGI